MPKLLLVCLVLIFPITLLGQKKDPVKVTDLLKIRSIGGVNMSRDGSKAVFTVTGIEPDGESKWEHKYVNQIWMVNTDGSSMPKQLTTKENASQPVFNPEGNRIAFTRTVDGKPQVFILNLDGGEAIQLTKFKYGAGSPKWSPDGSQVLFSSGIPLKDLFKDSVLNPSKAIPDWPFERPGFTQNENFPQKNAKADPDGSIEEIRAYLDNNVTDKKARVINKLSFQDETDVNPEMDFNVYFTVAAKPDAKPVRVTKGFYRYNFADFTPDGKQIILAGDIDSLEHPDRSLESQIYLMNNDGSGLRKLLGANGKLIGAPSISPSGKWLAYREGTVSFVNIPKLLITSMSDPGKVVKEIPLDRAKGDMIWSADEKYLYFVAQSNGGAPLYRAEVATGKVEPLTDYESGIGSFAISQNRIVYVKTEVANPFELYVADNNAKNAKRISNFNYDWVQGKALSFPEKKSFVNEQGMTVEYWIMKPTNFQAGKKYPLLLEIHGGPSSMWGPGEASMWHEYQYFCSQGYGVVYSNPRGSHGYGEKFLRANINDWGTGPTNDVLTALNKTIEQGWADTSKLVITGGSYAGYLVAWIIAHDNRFKAACAQRGVYDLSTFFGEGNAWRLVPNYFGGYPWDPATKATIERESPINYVQNINTPFIIFHGENDRRTGVIQSEMMYRSLKAMGKEVEYVRHPTATHEITRSGNNRQRIDQMLRTYEFFQRYIR